MTDWNAILEEGVKNMRRDRGRLFKDETVPLDPTGPHPRKHIAWMLDQFAKACSDVGIAKVEEIEVEVLFNEKGGICLQDQSPCSSLKVVIPTHNFVVPQQRASL
jgi:hypothetical protein